MKVNNRDSVEISQMSRSKKGDAAHAAKRKAESEAAAAIVAGDGAPASVDISGDAKAMAAASQAAKAESTDQAKIDRIKAMMQSGTYKPDYGKVADKMLNETLLQDIS